MAHLRALAMSPGLLFGIMMPLPFQWQEYSGQVFPKLLSMAWRWQYFLISALFVIGAELQLVSIFAAVINS